MKRLADKVAVIIGGSRGIGLATATLFAQEGAKVLLVARSEQTLQQAVTTIGPESASYVVADVSQPEQVERYVQVAVQRNGGIDLFINNAGIIGQITPITQCPIKTFDQVMAVNVRGAWLGLKYVIPEMQKRGGGSIVITSSIGGVRGYARWSPYAASKHAQVGMMRSLARECAPHRIRINTVNPNLTETDMMKDIFEQIAPGEFEEHRQAVAKQNLLNRIAKVQDVAEMMLFLSSDAASYCTGGIYMVDGGATA